jgi:hypothetical protein
MYLVPRSEVLDLSEVDRPWKDSLERLVLLKAGAWGSLGRRTVEDYGANVGAPNLVPFDAVKSPGEVLKQLLDRKRALDDTINRLQDSSIHTFSPEEVDSRKRRIPYDLYYWQGGPAAAVFDAACADRRWAVSCFTWVRYWAGAQLVATPFRRAALLAYWSAVSAHVERQIRAINAAPIAAAPAEPVAQQPHGHVHQEDTI